MPTLATGSRPLLAGDNGYTLVEAMATILIVAMLSSAVLLATPGRERRTRDAAELLATRLALASDESILVNRPVALIVNDEGYGFARLQDDGWRRIETRSPLIFRAWPDGLEHRVEVHGAAGQDVAARNDGGRVIRFDALGGATPAQITLSGTGVRFDVDVDGQGRASVVRRD